MAFRPSSSRLAPYRCHDEPFIASPEPRASAKAQTFTNPPCVRAVTAPRGHFSLVHVSAALVTGLGLGFLLSYILVVGKANYLADLISVAKVCQREHLSAFNETMQCGKYCQTFQNSTGESASHNEDTQQYNFAYDEVNDNASFHVPYKKYEGYSIEENESGSEINITARGCHQMVATPVRTFGNIYHSIGANESVFNQPRMTHRFSEPGRHSVSKIMANVSKWSSQQWEMYAESIMRNNVRDGILILALANYGMREMTMNFVASLAIHQYDKFVIVCLDMNIFELLILNGHERNAFFLPQQWVSWKTNEKFAPYMGSTYLELLYAKLEIVLQVLSRGYRLLYTDVDLVFLSPHVTKYILMEDETKTVDFFYMVDSPRVWGDEINGGFWVARPSRNVIEMFNASLHLSTTNRKYKVDQTALNHYLMKDKPKLKNSATFVALPRMLFLSGYYYKERNHSENVRIFPMVVHANWIMNLSLKEDVFKQKGFCGTLGFVRWIAHLFLGTRTRGVDIRSGYREMLYCDGRSLTVNVII